jgi:dephospho-CoA kinase
MLRIGLTGGIGAGKSTVSATFNECGGIIVDGDVIAREVVEPGTQGLAQLVEAFVVVEDIPLLVETGMAPLFPLVVVVTADEETRIDRLIKRGMDEADARARIKAQAPEEQRRAIADVLLDNSGAEEQLAQKARDIWYDRVLPLADNIRHRRAVKYPWTLVPYNPEWPDQAQRIIRRIQIACGPRALRVDHIGSTAVPGFDAKDVIDVQLTVASLEIADEVVDALTGVGYPRIEYITADTPHTDDPALWQKRLHGAADPGRPVNIHVRVDGWPGQQFALLFRDWLRANPDVQSEYVAVKRNAQQAPDYPEAKEPWFDRAYARAWSWAGATGWRP